MKTSSGGKYKKSRKKSLKDKIKKHLRKLSIRQIQYRQNRLAGMPIYSAARAAKYSQSYARSHAADRLEKTVKDSIIDELEMAGLTNKRQAQELTRIAFSATTTESARVYREDEDGNIVVEDAGREVPDNYARLRALEQAGKLKKQISAPFEKSIFGQDYKRLIIVVENDTKTDSNASQPSDPGGADRINITSKLRVETSD